MKKRIFACALGVVLLAITSWANDKEEEDEDRLKNAGTVLTEILNIPDNIPQDLLDKGDCVVVFPSVLKAAFVVGGSYGRGVMTCRTIEDDQMLPASGGASAASFPDGARVIYMEVSRSAGCMRRLEKFRGDDALRRYAGRMGRRGSRFGWPGAA